MPGLGTIPLGRNEKVVNSWRGQRAVLEVTKTNNAKGEVVKRAKDWRNGNLVLTNRRLVFIDDEGAVTQPASIRLTQLIDTWRDKTPLKVSTSDDKETLVFRLEKVSKKKEFEEFKQQVLYYSQKLEEIEEAERVLRS